MGFKIEPFETLIAEGATLAGIHVFAKNGDYYDAAQAALGVANFFSALGSGDVATAQTDIQAVAVAGASDPGLKQFLTDLMNMGWPLVYAQLQLVNGVPVLGSLAQGVATNIAAGITAVASQYPAPAPQPAPAPAPSTSSRAVPPPAPSSAAAGLR